MGGKTLMLQSPYFALVCFGESYELRQLYYGCVRIIPRGEMPTISPFKEHGFGVPESSISACTRFLIGPKVRKTVLNDRLIS
ncbi:hypothetical protein K1719_024877 [Acacia pycnantha]|nr:hypothetical protein K1719_024877 [Acacia pycnantha]